MVLRALFLLTLSASLMAQGFPTFMSLGNVIHGFGSNTVALLDTGLQASTPLQIAPAGLAARLFTWDRNSPDDLLVWASDGIIYRSTVTSGGVNVVPFSQSSLPGVSGLLQLSWDQQGDLIATGDTLGHKLFRIDRITGAVTPLLAFPFPSSVRCGLQHPGTGDFYIGTSQAIWRVSGVLPASPSVTQVHLAGTNIKSMTFDPSDPRFLLFLEGTSIPALRRLDTTTLQVQTLFTGLPGLDLLRADEQGSFVGVDNRNVYRLANPTVIPMGGITPVLLGTNPNIGCCTLRDTVVIGETFDPFRLDIDSQPNGSATIQILNPPPGTTETWTFVSGTTIFPVNAGPWLGIFPDGLTLDLMASFPTPQPGLFLHSAGAPPALTAFPPGSLTFLAGQTWDWVTAAFGPFGAWYGKTNVERVTWQ